MNRTRLCSCIALVSAFVVGSSAVAAPTAQEAINDYNSGKYLSCLQKLQALNLKNNATSHYYIALCAQNLNRMTEAKAEYNWVITYGTEPLRSYAQKGLSNLDKLHAFTPSAPVTAAPVEHQPAKTAVATTGGSGAVKKIIDFSTTWCRPCQAFKPSFEEAKTHFKDITFVSLDGDNPDNAPMKEKYNVSAYPTLVYLDGSGKVLKNEAGAPNSLEDFESMIKELNNPKK
ncbi:hypothetical protein BH10CYA1_BH10CYA1_36420 [soil metagenome]